MFVLYLWLIYILQYVCTHYTTQLYHCLSHLAHYIHHQLLLYCIYEGANPQSKGKGFLKLHTTYYPTELTIYIHLHQPLFRQA